MIHFSIVCSPANEYYRAVRVRLMGASISVSHYTTTRTCSYQDGWNTQKPRPASYGRGFIVPSF